MIKSSINQKGHFCFTIDEGLLLNEIITDCQISTPFHPITDKHKQPPALKRATALWDTGNTNCSITKKLADSLGLKPISKAEVHHGDGKTLKDVYLINLALPNNVTIPYVMATECAATTGKFDVIIGMSVINKGDFAITNKGGKTVVSFRTPSIVTIDFNEDKEDGIKNDIQSNDTSKSTNIFAGTARNAPCPCNSGKKFKHCHGKAA